MTYNNETRQELAETERAEELQADIREKAHEINDGALETWIKENREECIEGFSEDNQIGFKDFCDERFKETFESWFKETKEKLKEAFVEDRESDFEEYSKSKFNEANE